MMALHNPYREYDKGMDDAYCGKEPRANNGQYSQGYERCMQLENDDDDSYEDAEFAPCSQCDGHPACEDFGCAFQLGLGRMVGRNTIEPYK